MNAVTKIKGGDAADAARAAPADAAEPVPVSGKAGIAIAGLALLRQPFPPHQISKLPKPTKAQTEAVKNDFKKGVRCKICESWHHPDVIHLDYVGHAALTDRLLDADPEWTWEPLALDERGLPAFDQTGGLWIKLTVCGATRLGYGHAAGKSYADIGSREKEVIGDALRNAAMRFGAALDLWHKGDLHAVEEADEGHSKGECAVSPPASDLQQQLERSVEEATQGDYAFPDGPATGITQLKSMARALWREIEGCGDADELEPLLAIDDNMALLDQMERLENPAHRQVYYGDGGDNPGISGLIERKRMEFSGANVLQAG